MAEYFTNVAFTYEWNGAEYAKSVGPLVGDATLTDLDPGDDTFSLFEEIRETGTNDGRDFAGTIELEGVEYVVLGDPGSFTPLTLYANAPDPNAVTGPNFSTGDIDASDLIVCFAPGTLIATPSGERAVEMLQIGDLVVTEDGRTVPVKWVGRQTVHKLFYPCRAVQASPDRCRRSGERFAPFRSGSHGRSCACS